MYVKIICTLFPLFHKLWEYGILVVGKPFVLNLNKVVVGETKPQSEFNCHEEDIKLFPSVLKA